MTDLVSQLAEVYVAVQRVPKTGLHPQGWTFATEGDIADMIRAELGARGIVLQPSVVEHTEVGMGATKSGAPIIRHTVKLEFILRLGAEAIASTWYGQADDSSDKGLAKALTAARKTFLLSTFLISTGDDPDAHDVVPEPQVQPEPYQPRSVRYQRWTYLCGLGLSAGDVGTVLKGAGVESSAGLVDDETWERVRPLVEAAARALGTEAAK